MGALSEAERDDVATTNLVGGLETREGSNAPMSVMLPPAPFLTSEPAKQFLPAPRNRGRRKAQRG
jgi:hypothetical protein